MNAEPKAQPVNAESSAQRLAISLCLIVLSMALPACRCDNTADEPPKGDLAKQRRKEATARPRQSTKQARLDLLEMAPRCHLQHRGVVLDLGSPAIETSRFFELGHHESFERVYHQGKAYARLQAMRTKFLVWLPTELEQIEFSAEVHGTKSQRIAAYVDGKRLGADRITRDESQVVRIRSNKEPLAAGRHELLVSLSRRRGIGAGADISWVRLGPPVENKTDTPAPRAEIFSEMPAGGEQRKAVVLRHGSGLRCPFWIPQHATLKTALGVWGAGGAVAEIAVRTSQGSRTVVRTTRLEEDTAREGWQPLELDLSAYGGQAIELELRAAHVAEGARLGFATPAITGKRHTAELPPHARRVVVFVLSGLGRRHEPPSAAAHGLPVVGALTRSSEVFSDYRVPTTSVPGVIASLLSGLQPWEHGLQKDRHMLRPRVSGLAEALQAAGGSSAFFTGVPLSFGGFGFDRGFERFVAISPVADRAATASIDEAQAWLQQHKDEQRRQLVLIHLRGGHPPFDITQETARGLPPKEYGGDLDPRRAAIQLGRIRLRRRGRRMPEEDWQRFFAMQKAALLKQDERIASFLSWLQSADLQRDTLVILMGDVGAGERPSIPFSLEAPLEEDYLQSLLLIRHPSGFGAGRTNSQTLTTIDVTKTIAQYLGLELPEISPSAIDLSNEAARHQAAMRAHVAYRGGAYSTRLGPFRLDGRSGRAPELCHLPLDPGCVEDRSAMHPIATRALWTSTWQALHHELSQQKEPVEREEQEDLAAALTVWGVPR